MPDDPFVVQLPSRTREAHAQGLRTAWREACGDLRLAYLAWCEAGPSTSRQAFEAYVEAADREAAAAELLPRQVPVTPVLRPAGFRTCGSSPPS
jgi:hypothetical protein